MWHEDNKGKTAMHHKAFRMLVDDGIIIDKNDAKMAPWQYDPYIKLYNNMVEHGFQASDYDNPETAALALVDMANNRYGMPDQYSEVSQVKAEVSINYGIMELTFGLTREYQCASSQQRSRAMFATLEEVLAMHDRAKSNLPAVAQSASGNPPGDNVTTIQTTHIRKEFYKDDWRIKLLGGEWSKWGVPVYPEMFPALGIDIDELEKGDHEFIATVGVLVSSSGKPQKVILVENVQ